MASTSNNVGTDFFRTFDIGLLAGREFSAADRDGAPAVVIVNQRFAERLRPDGERHRAAHRAGWVATREIVGVVADVKSGKVTGEIEPQVFLPRHQSTTLGIGDVLRSRRSAPRATHGRGARDRRSRRLRRMPITDLRTMGQQFRDNLATERFVAGTSTAFAVLATALAALGLYGVLAYSVAQRSREIGLRVALGAPAARIRAMVLRQVGGMAVIGVVLGIVAALLLGRAARSLLFGVEAGDPARARSAPRSCSAPSCSARPTFRPGERRAWIRWSRSGTNSGRSVGAVARQRAEAREVPQRGLLVAGLLIEPRQIEVHVGDARVEPHGFEVLLDRSVVAPRSSSTTPRLKRAVGCVGSSSSARR